MMKIEYKIVFPEIENIESFMRNCFRYNDAELSGMKIRIRFEMPQF